MTKAKNKKLNKAKAEKNDEFYTLYEDIENELKHYKEHFKGKVIYCNCDNPYESNFAKYFLVNFNKLGLKKLYATCYSPTAIQEDLFSDNNVINKKAYFLEVNTVASDFSKDQKHCDILEKVLKEKENSLET